MIDPKDIVKEKVKEEKKSKYLAKEVRDYEEMLDKKTTNELLILILLELRKQRGL